ncbi:YeeE/YedE thiosulfate transporter family protein [Ignatzschineria sp. RMDPL8A]|uniref:YeeE/YedE family protein n=1 Tax=Ignatzschineria sp. RMDPL8A TaxID=2999236 RepID=UPI002446659D|nr:YeeE/YedE thiosulfate transporter family protein [Ignatzschineria sp. RMDPL8A]MDG9730123.1 YeeE/YedE thiosulfate transporter family protein [Ignatzschineria sp. RMDPL8A]
MDSIFSLPALLGGLVIGLAAALYFLFLGRVMGVSGIIGNLLSRCGFTLWRLLFVVGLLASPWIYGMITEVPVAEITDNRWVLIIGGLLVGLGSAMSSGCTSGHSICGISRLSPSSVLVTIIFMVAGGMAVFVIKHLLGL